MLLITSSLRKEEKQDTLIQPVGYSSYSSNPIVVHNTHVLNLHRGLHSGSDVD